MISTHWARPHKPDERSLRLLDILARQAADLIERKMAEEALRMSERRLARELQAQQRLHEVSMRLARAEDVPSLLQEILDASI